MAAANGRTLRIYIGDGASPEVFSTIAGVQECGFSGEVGEIDITDKDSNGYRELLEGGIRSLSLSANGVTKSNALLQMFIDGGIRNMRMVWEETDDMIEGAFEMGTYEETGATENAAITFTAEFRSSGEFTFTPGTV